MNASAQDDLSVAVIGMSCRFPGARNIAEFWRNLREGVESITFFSDEELRSRGVDESLLRSPDFVKAAPVIDGVEYFDARFFGYSPREAELIDPQHRLFLECCWEAMECAGHVPGQFNGAVGVFGGMSLSSYLLYHLWGGAAEDDPFQAMLGNDKDFLTTRVSYDLNLKGPSLDVQTGCSTSLVAVHLACQALLNYQCDLALAGGVSVQVPARTGYLYQEGGLASPDGHCRTFDANARGTLFGSGAGVILLRRLNEAVSNGDHIHAVIRGSAVNNDGSVKVGYTAPSVEGQTEVIQAAHAVSGVDAESIGYLECHGTGTALGDPIEMMALANAFRPTTKAKGFCAVGSVKTNIGHLDAAAGVAGLIKTVLALENRAIPASLHFERPNPAIDFDNSPFFVNTALRHWPSQGPPRRAGVSSFGIGGTNAHVILEEAPDLGVSAESRRQWHLLLISGATGPALEAASDNLRRALRDGPDSRIADVAYTTQAGRRRFAFRRAVIGRDAGDAALALETGDPLRVWTADENRTGRAVAFMLPGGGAQHIQMGRGLYESEPVFREEFDACCGPELRSIVFPDEQNERDAALKIRRTGFGLPALVALECALARLWMSWGIRPRSLIGHSVGEYVAAYLAGIFTREEMLHVVRERARLFETLPHGAMLSVALPVDEARSVIGERLALAAVNTRSSAVFAGAVTEIEEAAKKLERDEVDFRRVLIDVAAHSGLVEPVLDDFRHVVRDLALRAPRIPIISNVTGEWMRAGEATDPEYWVRHLRETVRFADGISRLAETGDDVLLEVGPGQSLTTLAREQLRSRANAVLPSMRHPHDTLADEAVLLASAGRLWISGAEIDWSAFHSGEKRRRCPLPTYPFQRERYWIDPPHSRDHGKPTGRADVKQKDRASWFRVPSWRRSAWRSSSSEERKMATWIAFRDGAHADDALVRAIEARGAAVIEVRDSRADHRALPDCRAIRILYTGQAPLSSLLDITKACEGRPDCRIAVVGAGHVEVEASDCIDPDRALVSGALTAIAQENDNIQCRLIDVNLEGMSTGLAEAVLAEIESGAGDDWTVAFRGRSRWLRSFEAFPVEAVPGIPKLVRKGGGYLITGGFGTVGLRIAGYLARSAQARLVLLGRSTRPPAARIRELEEMGAEVMAASADVADRAALETVVREAELRFGRIDGVIHAAGFTGSAAARLISETDRGYLQLHLRAKRDGTRTLADVFASRNPEFVLLCSSTASVLGGVGLFAYSAANAFLDAFACGRDRRNGARWISVNWDLWPGGSRTGEPQTSMDRLAMTAEEAEDALSRVLAGSAPSQLIVSTGDLDARLKIWITKQPVVQHNRPKLASSYVAPMAEMEKTIANLWQELLGMDRVGVNDNFFELGGNSLTGLRMIARLKKLVNADIPMVALFEGPTVSALARVVSAGVHGTGHYDVSSERGARRRAARKSEAAGAEV